MKTKLREMQYKSCLSEVKDIDEKGTVIFHGSIFGIEDRVQETVDQGAYTKTINESFNDIQHYKNHDSKMMPGVIQKLSEDSKGLLVESKLILKTQVGLETYEQYKAMAEAGKSMGHSIGYAVVRDDKTTEPGVRHLKEIALFEVSTLTMRAAHPDALTVGIKALDEMDFEELIKEEKFYTLLLECKFPEVKLEQLELIKNHISALIDNHAANPHLVKNAPHSITLQDNLFTQNLTFAL